MCFKPRRMKVKKNGTWTNVSKLQTVQPAVYYMPVSHDDLVTAVREAEQRGWRVRAVGAGHSSTDVAVGAEMLLDLKYLNQVSHPDKEQLRSSVAPQHLAQIEAGCSIHKFNRRLDEMGLAFRALGIVDDQTISGAIATGTHANVRSLPGFPGLVKSVLLVAAGGKKYRLEPADGITDPSRFSEKDTELIQNDDTFNASLIHLGTFGIVASYIIDVEPQYWLMEKRTVEKWSSVREQIAQDTLYRDYPITVDKVTADHPVLAINIALNPHEVDGDHLCMVARFFKLAGKPKRKLGDIIRSPVPSIVLATRIPYHSVIKQAKEHPEKTPGVLNKGIQLMHDKSYINRSFKVWYQGMEAMVDMTYGAEFAFDGTYPGWLNAVDAVFNSAKTLSEQGVFYSNTLMIRYCKRSPAWLAPEHGFDTAAWIGTPVPIDHPKREDILNGFQETCIAAGGKAHWGKMNNRVTPELVRSWIPKLDQWKAEMRKFNPNNTFSNAFTDRFGLTSG